MIRLFFQIILIVVFFQIQGTLSAQGFLKVQGKQIVDESGEPYLLRGMGLGGWMLQEGYMLQTADFANPQWQIRARIEDLIGPAATERFYEAWLANHMRKADVDSLKSWGFNSVRLPMHYNLFTLPIEEEPVQGQQTWLDKGFELTDSLISWCAQNEMYVILDLHAAPGGQGYEQGISDYNPAKPSLWESTANQDKTVALWRRLAERYVDQPWVAGYDLLNEPNWNMNGNLQLRQLYGRITDAIRGVDNKHILFIEGNWFANDFTGLTPPWDDNLVYSPHKYWTFNDKASIQWVLDLRDNFQVPIYFGESGENSNVWFRDAIRLLEDNGMGWAWWPLKKVESIAGPLSVIKSPQYQSLLDYWKGNGNTPDAAFAEAALMDLTEKLKIENCIFQKDVIDAMFRQTREQTAVPYRVQRVPGVVFTSDFDMGPPDVAYYDAQSATYHVSTGNYTAWNQGWAYRNDGVDIGKSSDPVSSNGYYLGWTATGEWMQYSLDVDEEAVYDLVLRVASNGGSGRMHLETAGMDITGPISISNTGGWESWQSVRVENVVLEAGNTKMRLFIDQEGFNLGSMEFVKKGATSDLGTGFLKAIADQPNRVRLTLNKPMQGTLPAIPAGFEIEVDGSAISIRDIQWNPDQPRVLEFWLDGSIRYGDEVRISYDGDQVLAKDGTALLPFFREPVLNKVAFVHPIPGRIEAEDYFQHQGIQVENSTDAGGGQNIGFTDTGDYMDYLVSVPETKIYLARFRTSAQNESGQVRFQKIDDNGNATTLFVFGFPVTGGWQTWRTTEKTVTLPEGQHHVRVLVTKPGFNLNWMEFAEYSGLEELSETPDWKVFPNPSEGILTVQADWESARDVEINLSDYMGRLLQTYHFDHISSLDENLDLSDFPPGIYFLQLRLEIGVHSQRIILR